MSEQTQSKKKGRPDRYYTDVFPYLESIQLKLYEGHTEKRIMLALSISEPTWYKYKKEHYQLRRAVETGIEMRKSEARSNFFKAVGKGEQWAVEKMIRTMKDLNSWGDQQRYEIERDRLTLDERKLEQSMADKIVEEDTANEEMNIFLNSINNPIESSVIK